MHADSQVVHSNSTSNGRRDRAAEPASGSRAPVSFATEELLLVDSNDRLTGYTSKLDAHAGEGRLHRAFSVFLFDPQGRVLIHQRSMQKPLWPAYWTNSCCSHPRRGETLEQAVSRRISEELGVRAQATEIYQFEYHAHFGEVGSEHELCHVYLARTDDPAALSVHAEEISAWEWMSVAEVDAMITSESESAPPRAVTPWFVLEWQALREVYPQQLAQFAKV